MPDIFPHLDIRADPKSWLQEVLSERLGRIFTLRFRLESTLNHAQLQAFDHQILHQLSRTTMKRELEKDLFAERDRLRWAADVMHKEAETQGSRSAQKVKQSQTGDHEELMKMIKNRDLLIKTFAYQTALWKRQMDTGYTPV